MTSSESQALSQFHPLLAAWFLTTVGQPTAVQQAAWPKIVAGEHVLITAPTGSGKTFTAFLWALNQLITGAWPLSVTSVLYVSPLRALNNDIRRNLLRPLLELERVFQHAGAAFPNIRVLTRSSDTPQDLRRKMLRHPPEILITTPESLNLLLSSTGGRSLLTKLATVILDEIHAVMATKRGVHLITAVDRLVLLSGEFQRLALSATVRPLETVAAFIGGFKVSGPPLSPQYEPRPVTIINTPTPKTYHLTITTPERQVSQDAELAVWRPIVADLKPIIAENRSTLVFVNSRRLCEKITFLLNEDEAQPLAYAHHGSLARELRHEVENKLKRGELRAIVATSSLELGIDIGKLDEVVLIQSPPSVSSAIQRIGRAGHKVGQISRATIFPTHATDFVEAAVLAASILNQDLEALKPISCPLDILAQIMLSAIGLKTWDLDELYVHLTASMPYRTLERRQFELVLAMLAGRYADTRIRELNPRVSIDRLDNTVSIRKGALLDLYTSGGTIPDRGYYNLRVAETNALIGDLDEEFVWERRINDQFTLGTQRWRIERITHNDVLVAAAGSGEPQAPFWRAEEFNRDSHYSQRIGEFLEAAESGRDSAFAADLKRNHCLSDAAATALLEFLDLQRAVTGQPLPHRHHLLVEFVARGPGSVPGNEVVLHTTWGGKVNRPYSLALDAAYEQSYGQRLELFSGNDCIALMLPQPLTAAELLSLVTCDNVERLLRLRLENSGFFGARFRECANRALLLPRRKIGERMPLWMTRLRAKKLMDTVRAFEDFPILLEAWRTCMQDEFDLANLKLLLNEVETGVISYSETHTISPSPMAQSIAWRQTNQYMYMRDEPASDKGSKLREDLIREVALSPGLRPRVTHEVVANYELKRQRIYQGYGPQSAGELLDWVKERVLIPAHEWNMLLDSMCSEEILDANALLTPISHKLVRLRLQAGLACLYAALENLPRIKELYGPDADMIVLDLEDTEAGNRVSSWPDALASGDNVLAEWLSFYGPLTVTAIQEKLGLPTQRLDSLISSLLQEGKIIKGQLLQDADAEQVCLLDNFEALLRITRRQSVPAFEPLPGEALPLFLAVIQRLIKPSEGLEGLSYCLEQLACYPAPAGLWETEVFPARLGDYDPAWLDAILQEAEIKWRGTGNRTLAFYYQADADLFLPDENLGDAEPEAKDGEGYGESRSLTAQLLTDEAARYDFTGMVRKAKLPADKVYQALWEEVWAGRLASDTFSAVRKGLDTDFNMDASDYTAAALPKGSRRSGLRAGFARWQSSLPAGTWYLVKQLSLPDDWVAAVERSKERVRLLLDRYGLLTREIVQHELPAFCWRSVFQTLRIMELAGEVVPGYFFKGFQGPQFISHKAYRLLQRGLPDDKVYWLCAVDPISPCGMRLECLGDALPKRLPGNHLVFCGSKLVLTSQRTCALLTFYVPPEDPRIQEYWGLIRHLLGRRVQPVRKIVIERINGLPAAQSPYLDSLRTSFDVTVETRTVVVYRQWS